MGNKSTMIRIGLLVAKVALLVGCSGTQGDRTVQLPEPKDVLREKWSDAMYVLTAMGISGQRDVPIELAAAVGGASPAGSSDTVLGDVGLSAVSFASPPIGLSSGAAAGIGLGLMLLGGASDPARATQVVAWVLSRGCLLTRQARRRRRLLSHCVRSKMLAREFLPMAYRSCQCRLVNILMVITSAMHPWQIAMRSGRSHSMKRLLKRRDF